MSKIVVCNTGPLTHLWQIDLWAVFGTFSKVHIAGQVADEIRAHADLQKLMEYCDLQIHSVVVQDACNRQIIREYEHLQEADSATLLLAQPLQPDGVLTDDLALRQAMEKHGQKPMGSVGLVLRAYKSGLLDRQTLHHKIDELFVHSTLYLNPQFKEYVKNLIATQLG